MMDKISKVHFHFLCRNSFHVKAENEGFTAAMLCCHQNLKNENFILSFGRLCQKFAPNSVLHMEYNYFSSFNQSNHCRFHCRCCSHFLNSLRCELALIASYYSLLWTCKFIFCSRNLLFYWLVAAKCLLSKG